MSLVMINKDIYLPHEILKRSIFITVVLILLPNGLELFLSQDIFNFRIQVAITRICYISVANLQLVVLGYFLEQDFPIMIGSISLL